MEHTTTTAETDTRPEADSPFMKLPFDVRELIYNKMSAVACEQRPFSELLRIKDLTGKVTTYAMTSREAALRRVNTVSVCLAL